MPLRVLVASHLYPSATRPTSAPWLEEQVRALRDRGAEVSVLCCSPGESDRDEGSDPVVSYRSTSAGPLTGTRPGLAVATLRYRSKAAEFLRAHREFDLVHAHFAFPDAYVMIGGARREALPAVVTLHGSDVHRVVARRGLGAVVRRRLASAQRVICVSEALARTARDAGLPAKLITTVPNGYDDTLFRLSLGERDLGYLFVGALRKVKNVVPLVHAYLDAVALHELPLTIVGDGPLRAEIEQLLATHPRGERVRLLGAVSREGVARAMQRATALVMPSLSEGYGVVAAEALACGTPVVASTVGAAPEILAGKAAGILVEPGDMTGLMQALSAVQGWPHSPEEVAAASGSMPWRARADELLAVYAAIAGEGAVR